MRMYIYLIKRICQLMLQCHVSGILYIAPCDIDNQISAICPICHNGTGYRLNAGSLMRDLMQPL